MILPDKGYKRVAVITFYIVIAIVLWYIFINYLLGCILPFAIAFFFAHVTRKAVLFLCRKCKFKRGFSVLLITGSVLSVLVFVFYVLVSKCLNELYSLTEQLNAENISVFLSDTANSISSVLTRLLPSFSDSIEELIIKAAKSFDEFITPIAAELIPHIGKAVMDFFSALPGFFLFLGALIIAMYYFACDYELITGFIKLQLSQKQREFVKSFKYELFSTIFNVIKANVILLLITFVQLLVGFIVSGINYSVLLAALIALIDILPVLGTGTVLIPWFIILFFTGNVKTGLCILILYVIITVVRQIAEPKIMGSSVGVHPLVTLTAMYFCIKLFAVKGLFLFPITTIIIKNLNEKGLIKLYKNPKNNNITK